LDTVWANAAVLTTHEFDEWLDALADQRARARILSRIRSATQGNFGDCAPIGGGVSEMRIPFGPGYRAYFSRRGAAVYWLLAGGDKSSQKKDIIRARALQRLLEEQNP
jgi:putative addiction module killer protein